MEKTFAVILAAGEGKRMLSDKAKVLHEVLFKPMIDWVTDSVIKSGINGMCVVVGKNGDSVAGHIKDRGIKCCFARQDKQLGTGSALLAAREYIDPGIGDTLVLCGDAPFVNEDVIKEFYNAHVEGGYGVTVLTAAADDPTGYGRIVRDENGGVTGIVEEKDASPLQRGIKEINAGAYFFKTAALLSVLSGLENRNAQNEYYLTDAVGLIKSKGMAAGAYQVKMEYTAGANTRGQLLELNNIARKIVLDKLLESGVSVTDASGVSISPDALIGRDTVILPGTIIKGKSEIGTGCVIGPNSVIEDCVFGDGVIFNASQARNSKIGGGATIGPFSNIRPDCVLDEKVHVGDFVELKNSTVGKGTKVAHLTYVGDSDVGGGVNFGCGVVTVNYDGTKKSRTTIGNNSFIGCNTNLVAPVKVGNGAYTAAGSTITKDIPDGALSVARSRQTNIAGWADKKLKKGNPGG